MLVTVIDSTDKKKNKKEPILSGPQKLLSKK